MKVYLFLRANPNGTGWSIQPVSWANPDVSVIPMSLSPSKAALEWLAEHGVPLYDPLARDRANCKRLYDSLGYWPEPFEADVTSVDDFEFDDSLECI